MTENGHTYRLRLRNASQLVLVANSGELFKIGKGMDEVVVIENGTVIVGNDGLIVDVGKEENLALKYPSSSLFARDIDCAGMSIVPGLCDAHTHPVWSGDRTHEFAMKLAGATYMEVHNAGGGIGFTVQKTRESSEEELEALLRDRVRRMSRQGTTLAEAKSGYGLECDAEMKLLRVIHCVGSDPHVPVELIASFLGAHSVPKGSDAASYTQDVIENQIPTMCRLRDEGVVSPKLVDVFLEKGVFNADQTRRILVAGRDAGLEINFHGDEINAMEAGELGGELSALAISHLERVTDRGIECMAVRPTFGVLLPTTAYVLRLTPPPARRMIEGGVPVALGSDFNPNAHCVSMPFVMNLACVTMKMTMNEALVAATLNAAGSMGASHSHGSIEVGKVGDFVVVAADKWEHLIYELVDPPIQCVVKRGEVVYGS
eukprot:TRINITY_DN7023_c0_g1_i1.p1 TRINITY_DN7023_c0_g1~~TRINITY_DN7023_c0_g1_i1.p1  ORF type:complete len:431 (+),score=113.28 TRINITY_DN7023_c0_g1_i1:177-1469(+)